MYSKICVKRPLSINPTNVFMPIIALCNAGPKYCITLQREHSAIRSTFIKLPFSIKTFILSILSGHFTRVLLYTIRNHGPSELCFVDRPTLAGFYIYSSK